MKILMLASLLSSSLATVAYAADKPEIGPAPTWVQPVSLPETSLKADDAPVRILLSDQQVAVEPGKQAVYTEVALKIQTPQGLAAGNISFPWRPDVDRLVVHKLLIKRDNQTIDVLGAGQTFTVVRREQNLENATLDGVLTANIQPEGLQVGDIVEFAATVTSSDPTFKGHVEQLGGAWNGFAVGRAHLRMQWPTTLPVRIRQTSALPALKPVKVGGVTAVELSLENVAPIVPPKGAPPRYRIGRLVELTDFASWAQLGALMAPLYGKASTLPAQGPLLTELQRIRALSPDTKIRTEAVLALVQDRVRYVALAMGVGGYVPTDAETTWSRRYGDCKGKTALMLALLHGLGVNAEPVAVSTTFGDGLDERLPILGLFNHVLVRVTIDGKTYWLDGTRTGDTSLDRLTVPAFGWGLPLVEKGAALVRMLPTPLEVASKDTLIEIDASAGLTAPAPTKVVTTFRGDEAITTRDALANLVGDARERALRDYWKSQYDFIEVKAASASFDAKTGEQRLSLEGLARMDWVNGSYETDGTRVGYKADFTRDPGPNSDAPFAVPFPYFNRTIEKIVLPKGQGNFRIGPGVEVDQTVGGIHYRRHATLDTNAFVIEKTERSMVPEFSAKEAPAAQAQLRILADRSATLKKPSSFEATDADIAAARSDAPKTATDYVNRALIFVDRDMRTEALADYGKAIELDPTDVFAWANRGITRIQTGDLQGAKADLEKAESLDPDFVQNFIGQGMLADVAGRPHDAIAAYTKALQREPDNAYAITQRALAYKAIGDDDRALADAASAIAQDPTDIDSYLLRANLFRRQGKTKEAIGEAVSVTVANPDNSYAYVVAANIYSAFHRDAEAMKAYDRALSLKPEAYVYLNRSLRRPKSDLVGRLADLDAALNIDPSFSEAIAAKAAIQSGSGDNAGAIATFTSALSKYPGNSDILVGRGIAYARSGDLANAEKDFSNARAKSQSPEAMNSMCWIKATAGVALESALADCNAALASAPNSAAYLDSRGLVLLRLGRLDDAIADYDLALSQSANLPTSLFGRAVAWGRKGNKAKSIADAGAAHRIDPDIQSQFKGYGVTLP